MILLFILAIARSLIHLHCRWSGTNYIVLFLYIFTSLSEDKCKIVNLLGLLYHNIIYSQVQLVCQFADLCYTPQESKSTAFVRWGACDLKCDCLSTLDTACRVNYVFAYVHISEVKSQMNNHDQFVPVEKAAAPALLLHHDDCCHGWELSSAAWDSFSSSHPPLVSLVSKSLSFHCRLNVHF